MYASTRSSACLSGSRKCCGPAGASRASAAPARSGSSAISRRGAVPAPPVAVEHIGTGAYRTEYQPLLWRRGSSACSGPASPVARAADRVTGDRLEQECLDLPQMAFGITTEPRDGRASTAGRRRGLLGEPQTLWLGGRLGGSRPGRAPVRPAARVCRPAGSRRAHERLAAGGERTAGRACARDERAASRVGARKASSARHGVR